MDRDQHRYRRAPAMLVIALVLALPLRAWAVDGEAFKLYEDALQRFESNDVAGSVIQLMNALQKDPNMLAGHVLLGKALLKSGNPEGAEARFTQALLMGADRAEVVLPLAQAYGAQGKFDVLLERLRPDGLPQQVRLELLVLRGNAQMELDNVDEALLTFDEARAIDPQSTAVKLAHANLLLRTGQIDRAAELVQAVIGVAPGEVAAWNLRGSIAHVKGDLQGALAAYSKAIDLDNGHVDAQVARAGLLVDLHRLEEADSAISLILSLTPREPRAAYLRAVVASRRNDAETVRSALYDVVRLIDPVPKSVVRYHSQLLIAAGLAHHGLGNFEKAAEYLALHVARNPRQPGPSKLLASLYIEGGDQGAAIALLKPLREVAPNDPQLLSLLAAAYMLDRRSTVAAELLEEAVRLSDGAPDLRAEFGVSLIHDGQADLGLKQLQQAFAKDPGQARAGMVLTTLYLKRNQPKQALETIEAVVRRDPKNVVALNLLGVARVAAGDGAGARKAYEAALAIDPNYAAAALNLVRLEIVENNNDAARARLVELIKTDPHDGDAMIELALLEARVAGRQAESIRWLEKAMAERKHRTRAGILLSDVLVRQRNFDRALTVAKEVVSNNAKDFYGLLALCRVELAAGRRRDAEQTLARMGPVARFDPSQNVEVARLQVRVGDKAGAIYSLNKALKGNGEYLPALVLLTELEIGQGEYAKAEQRARGIEARFPRLAVGSRLLGDLSAARRQFGLAIAHYRAAFAKDKSADIVLRLYSVYARSGDSAKGLEVLEQYARDNPHDISIVRAFGDANLAAGKLTAARAAYEQLLQRQADDVDALNNLAQVALRQRDPDAVKYAERAYGLARNDAAVIDTLGWVLVRQGDLDRGIALLRDARLRDAANPEIRYHLAAGLAKVGRTAEARNELKEIFKGGASFEGLEEARKLERELRP
jgi:putative PEP-CTERM system TPR-repeat lipoprotein